MAKKIVRRFCIVVLFQLMLYLVQYILIPMIHFPSPQDETLSNAIVITTTVIISFVGLYWFVNNVLYWLVTVSFYYLFVSLYCPDGLYRINYRDQIFGYMTSPTPLTITLVIMICEVCVWIFVILIQFILRRLRVNN